MLLYVNVLVLIVLALIALKLYWKLSTGRCTSNVCLVGKTALVTGGNSGIGYQTVLALATRGCRVIIADKEDCVETKEKIIRETGNRNILIKRFDLASLATIRALAKDINESEGRLDILINNAGSAGLGDSYTEDELHVGMQVNHFGPFLLTHLLLDLLKKSAPSRIVFVSSILAFLGRASPDHLNSPAFGLMVYSNSKLCNLITVKELAKKLRGTGVTANSLHPGFVVTPIYKKYFFGAGKPKWFQVLTYLTYRWLIRPFFKTVEEGAQTSIHLAVAKEVENVSGAYFWDCGIFWALPPLARNVDYCRKIWKSSEEFVKLTAEERV